MPKDVIEINADRKFSTEQDQLKNTVWEMFHDMLEKFKNRMEDPELEMTDMQKKVGQKLSENMENLLDQMKIQYQQRNQMGNYLPMRSGAYLDLQKAFKNCLREARYLSGPLAETDEARTLRAALAKGRNAMTAQDKDNLPSLAQALSGLIPSTVRLVNTDISKMEGGMNSRMAVKYTDELGIVHEGFLTKEDTQTLSFENAMKLVGEAVAKKYPEYADAISKAVTDKSFVETVGSGIALKLNQFYKSKSHDWLNELEGPKKIDIYKDLVDGVFKSLNKNAVLYGAGIQPGSKLARRNGAMSDIARHLGFPNLLAESRRVTIEQNGKKIDGVMMEAADMEALDNMYMNPDSPFFKVDEDQFNSEPLLRSLADLQILDYICGNTDRHKANFFTRFDMSDPTHPKITGVQGIDNDTSFGEIKEGGHVRLAKEDNLKIITRKMAEAVTKMSREDLDEILSDYGLSQAEKEAANARLGKLQGYIQRGDQINQKLDYMDMGDYTYIKNNRGTIHIVDDDEWKNFTLKGLGAFEIEDDIKGQGNIFNQMMDQLQAKRRIKANKNFTDERKVQYTDQDVLGGLGRIRESLEEEYEKIRNMKELLAGKCKENKGGHKEFTDLANAVNFLNEKYEKVLKDTDHVRTMDDATIKKLNAFYKTLADNREEISQCASAYENTHTGLRFSPMGRGRRELAETLRKFVAPGEMMSQKLYDKIKTEVKEGLAAIQGTNVIVIEEETEFTAKVGKDAYESAPAAANQLAGLMESTMRRNMEKLSPSEVTYALGVKALEAQKRLWNYSQSQAVKELSYVPEVKESAMNEKGKERLSIDDLVLMQDDEQIRKDVSADVKAIMDFVGKQSSSAKKNILSRMEKGDVQSISDSTQKKIIKKEQSRINKNEIRINPKSMTPKEAMRFLGMVFEQEAKIASAGKTKGKPAPAKQKGK